MRWTQYGRDSAVALREEISTAKDGVGLAPVAVVVPSNQVGVSVRRQLAGGSVGAANPSGPGLLAVTFLTPYRLAELLGASALAAEARRPVSTPVLAAAMRRALGEAPGSFAPVAGHPATESALVAAYQELRDVSDEGRRAIAALGPRPAELVDLVERARAWLKGAWYDQEDLMAAASAAARTGHGELAGLGSVVVYLPQRLGRHAVDLLTAVGAARGLRLVAGTTGVPAADIEVVEAVRRLVGQSTAGPEQLGLFPPIAAPSRGQIAPPSPGGGPLKDLVGIDRTELVTTSDADEEVRTAVRTVLDAVRAGTPLDRIAVLHAAPTPYARLLHDHLAAAGVTTNGIAPVPLAGRVASRALLGLLALPAGGFRREDVFAWMTGFPLLDRGAWVPAAAWERISREAGVVAGPHQWDERLSRWADEREQQAAQAEADPARPEWEAERARTDARRAHDLRRFIADLVHRTPTGAELAPWSARVDGARGLISDLLGTPERDPRWSDQERRAADQLDRALARLEALDGVEGPVDAEVFARTLVVELEATSDRVGRFGTGVLVGPVSLGLGLDLDLLIVVGLAEGTFPAASREDSLLPDDHRVATEGELALRGGQVDRLHRWFLAALAGATAQVLTIPLGDLRRSRDRVPSRWALDVATELAGTRWWSDDLTRRSASVPAWLRPVASFDAGLRAAPPATEQEHRLRTLMSAAPSRIRLGAVAAAIDPVLARGVATVDARRSVELTRFDGNLQGLPIPSPLDHPTSATALELWARCPHSYLMKRLLKVEPLEAPEDVLQITPLDRGNLVHEVLEAFVREVLASGAGPAPEETWSAEHHRRIAALGEAACDRYAAEGRTGHDLFWRKDRRQLLKDLDRVLAEDDHRRRTHRSRPAAAELAFGFDGAAPAAFPLPDGRTLEVRGRVDRVEVTDDGGLRVVDYKTGKSTRYGGLNSEDPHQYGQHLQLAIYGVAVRQHLDRPDVAVEASYWFTSQGGGFKEIGYPVTDEVIGEVGRAIQLIVEGIEAGAFPPHPSEPTTSPFVDCHYCDPDGLGVKDGHDRWLHKLQAPALEPYRALLSDPDQDEETS